MSELSMNIIGAIAGRMTRLNMHPAELAAALDMSDRTFRDRMKKPGSFRVDELETVAHKLCTTTEALMEGRIV